MKRALQLYSCLIVILLIFPIIIVVMLSFGDQGSLKFPPTSYSLRWFRVLLNDRAWLDAFVRSLHIATMASIVSTVVGFLFAYGLRGEPFPGRNSILWALLVPIMMPSVIIAVALYFLSAQMRLIGNVYWLALCHSVVTLPISVLILLSSMKSVDQSIERAAANLGAGTFFTLTRVIIPMTASGIISSTLFAFLTSFDELIISLFLTGARSQTLPVRIWNSLIFEVEPVITAVSTVLIALTVLALVIDYLAKTRQAR